MPSLLLPADSSSEEEDEASEDKGATLDSVFKVSARVQGDDPTEQDDWRERCRRLAQELLRDRPTLPPDLDDPRMSLRDVSVAIRLPCFSCPFKDCLFCTDDRADFMLHVGGMQDGSPHWADIQRVCGTAPHMRAIDWVGGAIACVERANFPRVGPATTRRALRRLTQVYSEDSIRALACFCCGQLRTTWAGPPDIDYVAGLQRDGEAEIKYCGLS